MDLDKEVELLKEYINDYVYLTKPMTLKSQVDTYFKTGFWESGYDKDKFMSFEDWKKIKIIVKNLKTRK